MLPTLPQQTNKPASPILSEAETIADTWSQFLPLELTIARAKQIVDFVADNDPDDPALTVLQYCLGKLDPAYRVDHMISAQQYRSKLCELKDNIYRKREFKFVSRCYTQTTNGQFNIPELDMPLLTYESVQRYLSNTPSIFSVSFQCTPEQAAADGKLYVAHGVRFDGLNFLVWSL